MSDEVEVVEAVEEAPVVETVAEETPVEVVETSSEQEAAPEPAGEVAIPDDVNEKINAKIAKHKHAARRATEDATYWKQQAQGHQPAQPAPQAPAAPQIDQFENYDDYVGATIDYRAEQKFKSLQQNQTAQNQQAAYQSKKDSVVAQGNAKHEDFYELTSVIKLSEYAMMAATELDNGSDAIYYLGKNPAEADRIYSLAPAGQMVELTKISNRLAAPAKTVPSKAPDPITPVTTAGGSGALAYHPDMSDADYAKMRRQQKKR